MKKKTKSHMLIEIKKLKDMRKNKSHLPKKKKKEPMEPCHHIWSVWIDMSIIKK